MFVSFTFVSSVINLIYSKLLVLLLLYINVRLHIILMSVIMLSIIFLSIIMTSGVMLVLDLCRSILQTSMH
jgi:hypothetical protein